MLQGLQHRGVGVGAGALVAAVLVDALHQRPAGGGHVEGVVRALQRKKVRQYSRPRVSDDNAFVESLFRTAKYRPQYPEAGFADLQAARQWASNFVHWYNHEHRHSGIRWRHAGAAPCRTGPTDFASTPRPLRPSPRRQPAALVWPHARLVTHQNRHPQP
ncbi:MAG: hypothetical protein C0441_00910 [Comamonadaceae bacterium]|nr:hypothetical protein [Comamonadaceae bacterium]